MMQIDWDELPIGESVEVKWIPENAPTPPGWFDTDIKQTHHSVWSRLVHRTLHNGRPAH